MTLVARVTALAQAIGADIKAIVGKLAGIEDGAQKNAWGALKTPAIAAGALAIDLAAPSGFRVTLNQNVTALTFAGVPSGRVVVFTVIWVQDATGGRTVAFPASVKADGGGAPVQPAAGANAVTVQSFYTDDGGVTVWQSGGALSVREQLSADRTYYVRPNGNDANSGLANNAGGAFLTIQKAIDVASNIDSGIYQTTIKIADGTYTQPVVIGALVGAKALIISGNEANPAAVFFNGTGICITTVDASTRIIVSGMKLQSSSVCLNAAPAGFIEYKNVIFGLAGSRHLNAQLNGYVGCTGNYTIEGAASSHATANQGGKIRLGVAGIATQITLVSTPNFPSGFLRAGEGPSVIACALTTGQPVFVGTCTGPKYSVSTNAVINTNGAGANYLPGDSAGTANTGGQYV